MLMTVQLNYIPKDPMNYQTLCFLLPWCYCVMYCCSLSFRGAIAKCAIGVSCPGATVLYATSVLRLDVGMLCLTTNES